MGPIITGFISQNMAGCGLIGIHTLIFIRTKIPLGTNMIWKISNLDGLLNLTLESDLGLGECIQIDLNHSNFYQLKISKNFFLKKYAKLLDDHEPFRFVGTLSLIFEVVL